MAGRGGSGFVVGAALATVMALAFACGQFSTASDPPTDSGAPSGDATDDATSGTTSEGGLPPDGGSPDAGCGHSFCADFEDPDAGGGWDGLDVGLGASAIIATGLGHPGNALRSSIPLHDDTTTNWAYVVKAFPGATVVHVELDTNLPSMTTDPATVMTILQVSGPVTSNDATSNESGVGVNLVGGSTKLGFFIAHGDGANDTPITSTTLPLGQWAHVTLEVRFGMGGHLKLLVDGKTAWDQPLDTVLPARPALRVGLQHYTGPTPDFTGLYDTVRVDVVP